MRTGLIKKMKRNSHFFVSLLFSKSLFFSPFKKMWHRIKRERALIAIKKYTEFRFINKKKERCIRDVTEVQKIIFLYIYFMETPYYTIIYSIHLQYILQSIWYGENVNYRKNSFFLLIIQNLIFKIFLPSVSLWFLKEPTSGDY